ncbi:MAG: PEP/pyruvate-binding domain-containing protein [Deltaproteobacteria bacterium]|nr:PEP/pyruvate-binding domain-containing protein [Deltaproteobacteria bacterium]MBW2015262.1 PEP/pyruvate-binding domain-containing protein [Deltaproteobacteria bacterium]MBW2127794.1 PEP/pyruvate-binding domain-containing protein [Deltaproteobacteria bacterium]MBW2302078.1 PEP/pyruvate-binding domain-containing protein [Deltaproteobacteria bacterium]
MGQKWLYRLSELRSEHNDLVGKKCANLGEMTHLGMKVPPGFAVSVDGYERFMEETGAGDEIRRYVTENQGKLNKVEKQIEASRFIRGVIESKKMPEDMKRELWDYYDELCEQVGQENTAVATRSSGAVSMPGQMETYLNVRGKGQLARKVIQVWGSAFTTRAIAFRIEKGMEMEKAPIGVAVLKMVNAKSAGVALTVQPTTGDLSKIVVEGNWGLGESVVSGEITPDTFIIDKETGRVHSTINRKTKMVVYTQDGTGTARVPAEMVEKPCLEKEELEEIARIAKRVEAHFGVPQDMEWVIDLDLPFPDNLFWVQTRPAKYSKKKEKNSEYLAELMTRVFKMG